MSRVRGRARGAGDHRRRRPASPAPLRHQRRDGLGRGPVVRWRGRHLRGNPRKRWIGSGHRRGPARDRDLASGRAPHRARRRSRRQSSRGDGRRWPGGQPWRLVIGIRGDRVGATPDRVRPSRGREDLGDTRVRRSDRPRATAGRHRSSAHCRRTHHHGPRGGIHRLGGRPADGLQQCGAHPRRRTPGHGVA